MRCTFSITLFFLSVWAAIGSSLDATFDIGSGATGLVEQVLPLSNGKILICGNFTSFNGLNRAYIARLNSNGSVDQTFTGQASYWVRSMAVQPDGKIVIGGFFRYVGGMPRGLIARLNEDGSLDPTFDPGLGATDAIAGGIDGNNDPFVFWVAVQADGKTLLTGNFRNYNGQTSMGFARVNPDGSRDSSFNIGAGLNSWGRHILLQPNGQILLSGWFTSYNNLSFNRIVRLNANGSPDTTFNPFFGDKTGLYCTALVSDGKMIASGHSLNDQGLFKREFARLNPDGSFDPSFIGSSNEKTETIAIQPDGKIIIGGYFSAVNGVLRKGVARLHPDGSLDDTLQADIDNFVWSVALQGDGKLLISGGFFTVDGVSRNGVARLNTGLQPGPAPIPTPGLTATALSTSDIRLNWNYSGTATGFRVERKAGAGGVYAQTATLPGNTSTFTSTNLSPSTQYYFRIRATTSGGDSPYSNEAVAMTRAVSTSGSAATFVSGDMATHGTWKGVYGAEGYNVVGEGASYPSYVQVTPGNKADWTWQWSTTDADALQRAANVPDRIAACWYSAGDMTIDLRFTDTQTHRVSIYFLDWDAAGRNETIQITDAESGAVLDSRAVFGFASGIYLNWDLAGHVKMTISPNAGNAVISGLFFGGTTPTQSAVSAPSISPNGGSFTAPQTVTLATSTAGAEIRYTTNGVDPTTASMLYTNSVTLNSSATVKAKAFKTGMLDSATTSATFTISSGGGTSTVKFLFVENDITTKGNWRPKYGSEGFDVILSGASYPLYVQAAATGKQNWLWNSGTTDARALQAPSGTGRIASCWYSSTSFDIDLNFSDATTHRLSAYFCDWDFAGRSQRVELMDAATGVVLHTTTLSAFSGGQYLVWDIRGHVKVRVTKLAGPNGVVSGLFFSPAPTQL